MNCLLTYLLTYSERLCFLFWVSWRYTNLLLTLTLNSYSSAFPNCHVCCYTLAVLLNSLMICALVNVFVGDWHANRLRI